MGYILHAVFSRSGVMNLESDALETSRVITMPQGFEMIPVTEKLSEVWGGKLVLTDVLWRLNTGWLDRLEYWSRTGRVAYLEIETWAGMDDQRAAGVWEDTQLIFVPSNQESEIRVTNTALSLLGVRKVRLQDEFDSLGLNHKRNTFDWSG